MNFHKGLTIFIAIIMTVLLIETAGCDTLLPEIEEEKVLKVGVLGPFTGRSENIGQEFKGAVEIAFEEIDYQIGDYRVELFWIDSQSDAKRAFLNYEEMVAEEEIDVGILNWHSHVAIAAMDVAARNKLPHFFGLGGTDVINEKFDYDPEYYSYYMAKTWPTPEKLTNAYVEALEYAIENEAWEPRNKKVTIYGENTDWGKSFGAAIAEDFKNAGWVIAGEIYITTGDIELQPVMKELREMDSAVIAGTIATGSSLAAFINQADQAGLNSVIIAEGLGWAGEWYDITGDSANYVLDQVPSWTNDEARGFVEDFQDKYGYMPSASSGGLVYDKASFFIQIAKETLEEYGELTRETLYNYGQEKLWTGEITYENGVVMNQYKYAPESIPDPVVGRNYFIFPVVQYFEGTGTIIWPEAWKVKDFEPPVR
ncbi:MAG: ABC transporter substrate-binding protein [Bacillota bacterium]